MLPRVRISLYFFLFIHSLGTICAMVNGDGYEIIGLFSLLKSISMELGLQSNTDHHIIISHLKYVRQDSR